MTKENKGKFWQNHDASTGAAVVGEKAHFGKKGCETVKKSRNTDSKICIYIYIHTMVDLLTLY